MRSGSRRCSAWRSGSPRWAPDVVRPAHAARCLCGSAPTF
jgi:hypothetical protein